MTNQTPNQPDPAGGEQKLNRRRILKVAIATAPIIATLPTGAALARSSNLIGAAPATGSYDAQGRMLCLDVTSGSLDTSGAVPILDLGTSPHGKVSAINARDYRVDNRWGAAKITEAEMCKKGGTFSYWRTGYGWKDIKVPKGLTVSSAAWLSFASTGFTTDM